MVVSFERIVTLLGPRDLDPHTFDSPRSELPAEVLGDLSISRAQYQPVIGLKRLARQASLLRMPRLRKQVGEWIRLDSDSTLVVIASRTLPEVLHVRAVSAYVRVRHCGCHRLLGN